MNLCKLKIGPRDKSLPATFMNSKVEINGREVKVYSIELSLKGDDPEDPIAIIKLPVDPDIDMQVSAEVKQPAGKQKPKPPQIDNPCGSCGKERENKADKYCNQCAAKIERIKKQGLKAASNVHGRCVEAYEGDDEK